MGWELALQDAAFKGLPFDCLRTGDQFARDVATYTYPYIDGGDTEDMGRQPRRFSMTAVFFGELYDVQLEAFLTLLDQPGPGELMHPVYGSIPAAQLLSHDVNHDANEPNYATVQLSFIEHKDSNSFFADASNGLDAARANAAMALAWTRAISNFGEIISVIAAELAGTSLSVFQRATSIGNVLGGIMGSLRVSYPSATSSASDYVTEPDAFAADVAGALPGLTEERQFGTALMSDWRGMVSDATDITALPAAVAGGVRSAGVSSDPIAIAAADLTMIESVVTLAVASDVTDTATQLLQAQLDAPTLSPTEVQAIAGDVRAFHNAAISKQRADTGSVEARDVTEQLKTAAKAVQDLAQAVILTRPPLVQREVTTPGNLHLIAFRWYGDFTRADELLRLNPGIRNPNFIARGEVLNGYVR